jgi:5-methylcytosine-specific restriction endonuclease McrA
MARTGLPNYRKLAFETYAPVCVYCGFGIKEVLEVAHLDCKPENCAVDNLAILCPTCHRMHDVDLIPTDVVRRLRDEKRKGDWAKLTKDAAKKAVQTKLLDPLLMKAAAKRAVDTRRARKAAESGA